MTRVGGVATLKGVQYEIQAVLHEMPELLKGDVSVLRYQPISSAMYAHDKVEAIHADDYSIEYEDGKRCYCQAKRKSTQGFWTINELFRRDVLQQFWRQHLVDNNSLLRLVSNIPATCLKNLAERARESVGTKEFEDRLSQEDAKYAEGIREYLDVTSDALWRFLQKVECFLLTENQIQKHISDFAYERYSDVANFCRVLKELIESFPGKPITREVVDEHLKNNGLFRLRVGVSIGDVKGILQEASGGLRVWKTDILGEYIEREEVKGLEEWIKNSSDNQNVAFLLDVAGSGKSVIMRNLLEKLEANGVPVLAIKADILTKVESPTGLQIALNLTDPPESLLAAAARNGLAVLLVDQLDALSMTFARDTACLNLVMGLIGRCSTIGNLRIVVACRSFDRKFDPSIRQIRSDKEFEIKSLTKLQVQQVLDKIGMRWEELTRREQGLLTNPQNLDVFTTVVKEGGKYIKGTITSLQSMYELLWQIKVLQPRKSSASSKELQDAIFRLAERINDTQVPSQSVSLFDDIPQVKSYLESEGLIRTHRSLVSFFHHSFFDYCYARLFVQTEKSLFETVRKGNQGLFVRAQILQILEYLRATDPSRYLAELEAMMDPNRIHELLRKWKLAPSPVKSALSCCIRTVFGKPIRYHIRHLVFEWFGQLKNLSVEEKSLGLSCISSTADRSLFLLGADGSSEWFDVVKREIVNLLSLPDEQGDGVVRFLRSVEEDRADQVFGLLSIYLGRSDRWNQRIIWCLNFYERWHSKEAEKCLVWVCEQESIPWQSAWRALYLVAKTNAALGCRLLGIILKRRYSEWLKKHRPPNKQECIEAGIFSEELKDDKEREAFYSCSNAFEKHARDLLLSRMDWIGDLAEKAINECPKLLVETILQWIEQVLPDLTWEPKGQGWLRDEVFELASLLMGHKTDSSVIEALRRGLVQISEEHPQQFLMFAEKIENSNYIVLHRLLVNALIENAQQYASWSCEYLLKDSMRFEIAGPASKREFSHELIKAIFPHLTVAERGKLEDAILAYNPAWENKLDALRFRGLSRLKLLRALPDTLLTKKGYKEKQELVRKFPDYRGAVTSQGEVGFVRVQSPIPGDSCRRFNNNDWLKAMRHYNDETEWDGPRESFPTGGVAELALEFEGLVEKDPQSFLQLPDSFDNTISSKYLSAFLTGLAKSSIAVDKVFEFCEKFAQMRFTDATVQRAIIDVVEKRVKENLPASMVRLIQKFALTASDPEEDTFNKKATSTGFYYGGDPFTEGINTIRGRAVQLYVHCVAETGFVEPDELLGTLEQVANDPSSAVRACLIHVLPWCLRFDESRVLRIFGTTVENRAELGKCHVFHDFVYHALGRHPSEMVEHIEGLLEHQAKEAREAGGRLSALVYFRTPKARKAKQLYQRSLHGDGQMRNGVAKVLARNVDKPALLEKCLAGLTVLMKDVEENVRRAVGLVFEYLPAPKLLVRRFIRKFLHSPIEVNALRYLVAYADRVYLQSPKTTLAILEHIQRKFEREITDITTGAAIIEEDVVRLVVSSQILKGDPKSKRRGLNLFERLMHMESSYARKVLETVDQRLE